MDVDLRSYEYLWSDINYFDHYNSMAIRPNFSIEFTVSDSGERLFYAENTTDEFLCFNFSENVNHGLVESTPATSYVISTYKMLS